MNPLVADRRLQVLAQEEFHRLVDLAKQVALDFVVIPQIGLTRETANLDQRTGEKPFGVRVKEQGRRALGMFRPFCGVALEYRTSDAIYL